MKSINIAIDGPAGAGKSAGLELWLAYISLHLAAHDREEIRVAPMGGIDPSGSGKLRGQRLQSKKKL